MCNILATLLMIIAVLIFGSVTYTITTFYDLTFQEIIFNLTTKLKSANMDVVKKAAVLVVPGSIILYILLVHMSNVFVIDYLLYSFIVFVISIVYAAFALGFNSYLYNYNHYSKFIQENYVDPKKVKYTFPKKKRNLIYIYLESMESTYSNIKGDNLIPNLTKLANNNINFSGTDKLGGATQIDSVGWTSAGIIASTTGLPFKINAMSKNDYTLKNFTTLSDILYDHGYNQEFMFGSDSEFGARKKFLKSHHYQITDYYTMIESNRLPKDYKVWWGYEDSKLFSFAKEDITKLAKEDKPFNFSLLTTNTHFLDGFVENGSLRPFKYQYKNAIYNSDKQVYEFIEWIKKQDFYDNTTIIISGDHLTMQLGLFRGFKTKRSVYNTIINSEIKPIKEKNRLFATIDMFPTILASLGVKMNTNRLGIGTNLFSDEKTILEKYNFNYTNKELKKKSIFYSDRIKKK